jgi:hypothetical protein
MSGPSGSFAAGRLAAVAAIAPRSPPRLIAASSAFASSSRRTRRQFDRRPPGAGFQQTIRDQLMLGRPDLVVALADSAVGRRTAREDVAMLSRASPAVSERVCRDSRNGRRAVAPGETTHAGALLEHCDSGEVGRLGGAVSAGSRPTALASGSSEVSSAESSFRRDAAEPG